MSCISKGDHKSQTTVPRTLLPVVRPSLARTVRLWHAIYSSSFPVSSIRKHSRHIFQVYFKVKQLVDSSLVSDTWKLK